MIIFNEETMQRGHIEGSCILLLSPQFGLDRAVMVPQRGYETPLCLVVRTLPCLPGFELCLGQGKVLLCLQWSRDCPSNVPSTPTLPNDTSIISFAARYHSLARRQPFSSSSLVVSCLHASRTAQIALVCAREAGKESSPECAASLGRDQLASGAGRIQVHLLFIG